MREETYPAISEQMNAAEVCSYITERTRYLSEQLLGIHVHLTSAVKIDGDKHPVFKDLSDMFEEFRATYENHLRKERQLIFPMANDSVRISGKVRVLLENELTLLKSEHKKFSDQLEMMRTITAGYSVDYACSPTCKLCMIEMKEAETDIKKLMSVEENILFPLLLAE